MVKGSEFRNSFKEALLWNDKVIRFLLRELFMNKFLDWQIEESAKMIGFDRCEIDTGVSLLQRAGIIEGESHEYTLTSRALNSLKLQAVYSNRAMTRNYRISK